MARKIVITSGKGGVGKTTICANLGVALSRQNKKVVVMDADIGLNNLDVVLGVENKVVYDIVDVIELKCRVKQALIQDINYPNLFVLPSAHSYDKSKITQENIKKVVSFLDDYFDFILIDCPAGIDEPFKRAIFSADEALLVVTPHTSSLRDADRVLEKLNNFGIENISLVVNRLRGDMILNNEMLSQDKIEQLLGVDLIGVIPEDDNISKILNIGGAVDRNCDSYTAFNMLSQNILGQTKMLFDCTEKYKGFLGFFKRLVRKKI